MAFTKKTKVRAAQDREENLLNLKNKPEEVFHLDEELAFSRDKRANRLLLTDLNRGLITELDVPFTEEFAVEKVKMDKDRKGFTMSGRQGEVWFDLENCWRRAKPLEKPSDSPFPEIIIDQDGPFSIFYEMDELTISFTIAQAGLINIRGPETGMLHFGGIQKFRCLPVDDNRIIEYIRPVNVPDYELPQAKKTEPSPPQVSSETRALLEEISHEVFDGVFDGFENQENLEVKRLHFTWTINGMCFECETNDISFSFEDQPSIWGVETDEFLSTILIQLETFDRAAIQDMVDYFRTTEGDEDMTIIYRELVGFLKNPDWNSFLKWGFDGTYSTGELRKILENILKESIKYMEELKLD
jgi:hypothetical protein